MGAQRRPQGDRVAKGQQPKSSFVPTIHGMMSRHFSMAIVNFLVSM